MLQQQDLPEQHFREVGMLGVKARPCRLCGLELCNRELRSGLRPFAPTGLDPRIDRLASGGIQVRPLDRELRARHLDHPPRGGDEVGAARIEPTFSCAVCPQLHAARALT
jgi:hypothetical protein